jgi:hypothetical protein
MVLKAVPIYGSDQSDHSWLALTAGRVRRSAFGPEPPFDERSRCCNAARRRRHSCILQHYAGWNVGLRTLPPFGIFFVKVTPRGMGKVIGCSQLGRQAKTSRAPARAWEIASSRLNCARSIQDKVSRKPIPADKSSKKGVNIYTSP